MRVLVTGGGGLLGAAMLRAAPAGVEAHATVRATPAPEGAVAHRVELSDAGAVEALVRRLRPDAVVHTAYGKTEGARDIVAATEAVARACAAAGARLVHVSSDTVLDGERAPYDEAALPAPVPAYGRWKAEAERIVAAAVPAAAIVRTSLLVAAEPPDPASAWVLDALRAGRPLTLFVDELRCPTHVADVAGALWELAADGGDVAGVWNLCGPEALSRYALGLLLAKRAGVDAAGIVPVRSDVSADPRPRDLRLLTRRAASRLRTPLRPITEALFAGR